MSFLFVASGGFAGAIARYWISLLLNQKQPLKPYGTWLANVSGSFLLGVFFASWTDGLLPDWGWYVGGIGFCGSYTTFSTFGNETFLFIQRNEVKHAVTYVSISLLVSFLAVLAALQLMSFL